MSDYFFVDVDAVHDVVELEVVRYPDDHFLHLYVEVQHLSVLAGHLFAVVWYAVASVQHPFL